MSGAANSGAMSSPWYFTSRGRYLRRSPLREPMSSTALPGRTCASCMCLRNRIRSSPAFRQLWRSRENLVSSGDDGAVFTSSYRGAPDEVLAGIPVHRFRYFPRRWENLTHEEAAPDRMKRSLLYRLMPACFVLAGMVAIWRLCRRARYDVIHVHWPLPLALFGWAAQRARPARLVTTFYGVELRWVKSALPFLKGFLAWAARRSDRVVAISHYTAGELRELADVPIEVIPYTTSLPEVAATSPAPDGKGPVLFVGRLVERKGVAHLIEAIARLGSRAPHLEIVGEGPERPSLEALAARLGVADRVVFRGKIPPDELQG